MSTNMPDLPQQENDSTSDSADQVSVQQPLFSRFLDRRPLNAVRTSVPAGAGTKPKEIILPVCS